MKIKEQLDDLRNFFNTKKIEDSTNFVDLTETEVEDIKFVIKTNKKDGVYEINDRLSVELKNGTAFIKENDTNE